MEDDDKWWLIPPNERRAAAMRADWAKRHDERAAAIKAGMHEGLDGKPRVRGQDYWLWAGGTKQKALDMLAAGVPVKAVAKRVGASQRTVYRLQWAWRREFLLGLAYRLLLWRYTTGLRIPSSSGNARQE